MPTKKLILTLATALLLAVAGVKIALLDYQAQAQANLITTVKVKELDGLSVINHPLTIFQVFKKGEVIWDIGTVAAGAGVKLSCQ